MITQKELEKQRSKQIFKDRQRLKIIHRKQGREFKQLLRKW